MPKNEFIHQVAACYYSSKNSQVLVGGVDTDQNLIIYTEASYTEKSVFVIARELLNYSLPVWINKHDLLKYALEDRLGGELDFSQKGEIESLNSLYDLLIAEKRLQAPGLTLLGQNTEPCLKVLVKSLEKYLCEQQVVFWADVGEPREIYSILEWY